MRLIGNAQNWFRYMRNQGMTWTKAIGELVDNSFDAGATRVELRFSNTPARTWEVIDDGHGCADIAKMLPIGEHHDHGIEKQPVGMYGIGLKDAWLFSGDAITVDTVHGGRRGTITLKTSEVAADFSCDDPSYESAAGVTAGTRIQFSLDRNRRQPQPETWDSVAWLFTPALNEGRQILFTSPSGKRKPLKPIAMPPFLESVEAEFTVQGKPVSIAIGIVKDGHKMTNGPFWVIYGHRIIRHSTLGAGRYSTLRMGGTIKLGKGWALTKNKDDLSDLSDELADAIHWYIRPLLEKHERLAEDVESSALKADIEAMLNDGVGAAVKERRKSPENETGRILEKRTGRKRRNLNNVQDAAGGGEKAKKRRGFAIDWMNDDAAGVGEFDVLSNTVRLNLSHPFVDGAKQDSNRPALYSVAVAIMSYELCNTDTRGRVSRTMFETASFPDAYSTIMRTMKSKLEAATNG